MFIESGRFSHKKSGKNLLGILSVCFLINIGVYGQSSCSLVNRFLIQAAQEKGIQFSNSENISFILNSALSDLDSAQSQSSKKAYQQKIQQARQKLSTVRNSIAQLKSIESQLIPICEESRAIDETIGRRSSQGGPKQKELFEKGLEIARKAVPILEALTNTFDEVSQLTTEANQIRDGYQERTYPQYTGGIDKREPYEYQYPPTYYPAPKMIGNIKKTGKNPPLKGNVTNNSNSIEWSGWHTNLGGNIISEFRKKKEQYPLGSSCVVTYKVMSDGWIEVKSISGSSRDFRDYCGSVFLNVNRSYNNFRFPPRSNRQYVIKYAELYRSEKGFTKIGLKDVEYLNPPESYKDFTKSKK
ncbi:MAG TPA: hypothetical protein PKY82_02410 [Pyrinomonadaceae bacterium]|nr:hypothetical protein [Pyrinomonadaceae bacterium]